LSRDIVVGPSNSGDLHAYPSNCGFGCIDRRACRSAARDREGAILPPLLAVSPVLAVLPGGRRPRHRRDDRRRAVRGADGAALLLRLLRAALLPTAVLHAGILRAAELLRAALNLAMPIQNCGIRRSDKLLGEGNGAAMAPFDDILNGGNVVTRVLVGVGARWSFGR